MNDRVEVLLVDDSPFIRRAVQRMLEPVAGVRVVATARNGTEAIDLTRRLRPDVVILDIVMPKVDGLQAIREIMATAPTPILVLSSHAAPGADVTLQALDLGAVDFIGKTEAGTRMDIYELAPVLREKVLAAAKSRVRSPSETAETPTPPADDVGTDSSFFDVLALGASTGGPRAIGAILSALPPELPAGVVVAQHMPPGFTATLAERLNRKVAMTVREARDGDAVESGVALIGVGGRQLRVERRRGGLRVAIPTETDRLLHRPSVDGLLTSVADAAGERAVAAVLTGMGDDGAEGLRAVRDAGGRTFAESSDTAVIFGMPRVAAPWADRVLPLEELGRALRDLIVKGTD